MFNKWQNISRLLLPCLFSLLLVSPAPSVGSAQQSASAMPGNIAIIFDLSHSVNSANQSPTIKPKDLKSVLYKLFQHSSQNQYFIIGVSTTPTVILNGSTDSQATLKALSKLSTKRDGATALFDACYLGIEKVAQGEPSKRVLLVVSDGVDNMSTRTLDEVKRALVEKKVKLYAVIGRSRDSKAYKGGLDEMASISGGAAFHYEQSKEINPILLSIVAKLQE